MPAKKATPTTPATVKKEASPAAEAPTNPETATTTTDATEATEAQITEFWKMMKRIDDSGIVELLFTPAPRDAIPTKSKKTHENDDTEDEDDDENDEFFGHTPMVPKAFAKSLVNTAAKDGTQPLLYAVQNNFDERTVLALLAAGADANAQRLKGDKHTPLIAACWGEDDVLATALLKHGAKVTSVDGSGMNCVHVCANVGAHGLLSHILAHFVKTSDELVTLLSAKETANGMTPLQLAIQELPTSVQQGDKRYLLTVEEIFQCLGVTMTDNFPQALATNTRSPNDVKVVFEGDNRKKSAEESVSDKPADALLNEEPTTGGVKRLITNKNPKLFPTHNQARKIFESKDANGSTVAHTAAEILGTIVQAQPMLRKIFTTFAYATFDANVNGTKIFTQQDAEGNTPLHLMLQHVYLTSNQQAASTATAMVVTTITPAIRSISAAFGTPANALTLEQMRNVIAGVRNSEGLSCLGLCAAVADVPAAASLSAELLGLWVSILPNPLDRRGLFGADAEAYRAFLLGWAISKQNAATAMKATNPEMAATILNPDAERRIMLDMNHCVAKIVGIPNILGTAETLSIFGGLPKEAALALRNESIGRAAKLAEDALAAVAKQEEEELNKKGGGCCGGGPCRDKKGGADDDEDEETGDFSGQGSSGEKTVAQKVKNAKAKKIAGAEGEDKPSGAKPTAAELAAVNPSKGLKWAAYGLMCMMLMGIFLPVIEFVFPTTRNAAPTRNKKGQKPNQKKKNTFREEDEPKYGSASGSEEASADAERGATADAADTEL